MPGGPKTENGKAIASKNALSHGMRSQQPVIPGIERPADWRRHLDGILASLEPEGELEAILAERVATLFWRLRRVTRFELAVITRDVEGSAEDVAIADAYAAAILPSENPAGGIDPAQVAKLQERRVVPDTRDLDKIMRYEAHLHRQCLQTLHELEAFQARRRGEQTHLARLDISSPPVAGALSRRPLERLLMR